MSRAFGLKSAAAILSAGFQARARSPAANRPRPGRQLAVRFRLAGIQNDKADKLPDGAAKDSHLNKARDHESSAHANDWRDSNLHAPK
jgi:hypothetical protein